MPCVDHGIIKIVKRDKGTKGKIDFAMKFIKSLYAILMLLNHFAVFQSTSKIRDLELLLESNDMDLIMMSEVKIKKGERLEDFNVKGYRQEAHLRPDHAEGGIIVWIKSNKSLNVEVWESLSSEKVEV